MAKRTSQYLEGVLAASVAVAEITGKQPVEGMSEREWELICKISARLMEMATHAAEEWAAA